MKAVHINPRIHDEASGPTYSVTSLCNSLASLGVETSLHVTHSAGQSPEKYRIYTHGSLDPSGTIGISPKFKRGLVQDVRSASILHNHSLWMMPNVYPGIISRPSGCKLICSPRGTMSDWAWNRSRWKKQVVGLLGQINMLNQCDCFHATAAHEVDDIRRRGFAQPIAMIPNGIDIPPAAIVQGMEFSRRKKLLFLARIHPVKGLESLLHAWQGLQNEFNDWELHIVGTGEKSYVAKLTILAAELNLERATFHGPVFGEAKSATYSDANLYVLPSHTENFGITVAESLAHGVPVITTNQTPWNLLAMRESGWCIPVGAQPLLQCLRTALSLPREKLLAMGSNGRQWMQDEFSWPVIAEQMLATYKWLSGEEKERPAWIRV